MRKRAFIFGSGYVASFLSQRLREIGYIVYCTSRDKPHDKFTVSFYNQDYLETLLATADVILSTVGTDDNVVDPVLHRYRNSIYLSRAKWIGYLSSTGVYGDHDGKWVNEYSACNTNSKKGKLRLKAEKYWLSIQHNIHILRLSGIYGPMRNCLEEILKGRQHTIIKQGHNFSRVHIEDICQFIISSISNPRDGTIYNVSDCTPAPLHEVHNFATKILLRKNLEAVPLEKANISIRKMSFFQENRQVCNRRAMKLRNGNWTYLSYKEGLLQGCLPYLSNI
ncbi:MAG: NAD-dependent epimerase/dehydratase [Candidatus Xenolissoclinum pacificiensis L6]|uniref:NAD-dependent epimerase/dehydratase n=1 Tax=Candidatus Xenolissoclinum pacificiensis L6 TaxID=1401685 RepID=W2V104_9RICK|nr:MAG: NAD-dependent epimerase/dehydratase [Candidatus Xenolissoclinum pacificiensis L6]